MSRAIKENLIPGSRFCKHRWEFFSNYYRTIGRCLKCGRTNLFYPDILYINIMSPRRYGGRWF